MSKTARKEAQNPRAEAMAAVVSNRLDTSEAGKDGQTLRESMIEQGVDFADTSKIPPEVLDSDTQAGPKDVEVDIESDSFAPEDGDPEAAAAPEETPEEIPEETPEQTPEAAAAEEEEEEAEEAEEVNEELFTLKVNGEERQLTREQMIKEAQKGAASTERFRAASERDIANDRREKDLAKREAALQNSPPSAPAPAPRAHEPTQEEIDNLYDAMAYEDEDTVKAKLAEVMSGRAPTQGAEGRSEPASTHEEQHGDIDLDAKIQAELDRRQAEDWEVYRQATVAQWEVENEDVAFDPELRSIAHVQSGRIAQQHPEQPLEVTLQQAADFARNFAAKAPEPNESSIDPALDQSRTERKRNTPAPVRTNGASVPRKAQQEEKPLTRSEVVARMRQTRGQAA